MSKVKIITLESCETGDVVKIQNDEFHYLKHVRRKKSGEEVMLFCTDGKRFNAEIIEIQKTKASLKVKKQIRANNNKKKVHLFVSPPKGNFFNEIIRRLSETGITRVTPLLCERTVAKPGRTKLAKLRKTALESMRQCLRAEPLKVHSPEDISSVILKIPKDATNIILHPQTSGPGFSGYLKSHKIGLPLNVFVGPEGGFTDKEIELVKNQQIIPVSLGITIMRIETAAVTAGILAMAALGEFD